jgi:hypothetical protein
MKQFIVASISKNANSFGLAGHVLVARSGEAYEVGRSVCHPEPWKQGQVVDVPTSYNRPQWAQVGVEIPRPLEKAPPKVVAELWKGKGAAEPDADPPLDARVENHGSLYLVRLLTPAAEEWVDEHVNDEAQFFGKALVVEPRYVENLVEGMRGDGLNL